MKRQSTHWTSTLALGVAAAIVLAVAGSIAVSRDPQKSLRLDVEELHARTVELEHAVVLGKNDDLPDRYVGVLAHQLRRQIDELKQSLRSDTKDAGTVAEDAVGVASDVTALAQAIADDPGAARASRATAERLKDAAAQLERIIDRLAGH